MKPGANLTIVTYGALVQKSLQAAVQMEQRKPGATVEVIDLRTLNPYDWAAIRASVEKTSRVMMVHEDTLSWGYGAEICGAHRRASCSARLDAPVGRVARSTPGSATHPPLENEILPQVENIVEEADAHSGVLAGLFANEQAD